MSVPGEKKSSPDAGLHLATISPTRPFLTDLARGILAKFGSDPLGLTDLTVYLPTRRAVRGLADVFQEITGDSARALLLPQLKTLGDIDELGMPRFSSHIDDGIEIPPAVSAAERRQVLAAMVRQNPVFSPANGNITWAAALSVADELGKLLDSFYTEQIPFERLQDIVPEHFAEHWRVTLEYLKIITEAWPGYLSHRNLLDPADRRRRLIDALGASWSSPADGAPADPVIIAGSTGSMPAVARLMRQVASFENGYVVLPGLDRDLDESAWQEIEDPHPQAGLKQLLDVQFPDVQRADISDWHEDEQGAAGADRQQLISLALRPAEATDDWLVRLREFQGAADLRDAVRGLQLVEAADEAAEANAVAMAMRVSLTSAGKTAILVTPDRTFARRVSMQLKRWGITLDDSAGVPLGDTLRGNFLRLVATWLTDPTHPAALLSLLKHPLCLAGFDRQTFAECVAQLDLRLRGLRPGRGFDALRVRCMGGAEWDALGQADDADDADQKTHRLLEPLINRLEEIAAPFGAVSDKAVDYLTEHLRAAEHLATSVEYPGASRLWAFEDGEAGAGHFAELFEQKTLLPADLGQADYPDYFEKLIATCSVRYQRHTHPRLMILGPLEARLQGADLVILSGLNEGTWPDGSASDPFLSRPMRAALGLPSLERKIGLSAHDFAQGACAPEVMLTRACKVERAPTKPSRWLVRLKNILGATNLMTHVDQTAQYDQWRDKIDLPDVVCPAPPPLPCPPAEVRPRRFSVTAVETLLRDPYSIFAKHILRLRRLESIDTGADGAVRGRFYHHLYARFAQEFPETMPDNAHEILEGYAATLFECANLDPHVWAFWQAQMEESFDWFVGFHKSCLEQGSPVVIEGKGAWDFEEDGVQYQLQARADRIDLYPEGLFIWDYKTGQVPTERQDKLFSPQLQLTGLIIENAGFAGIPARPVIGYGFVRVVNNNKDKDTIVSDETAQENIREAEGKFRSLLRHFQQPSEPYRSQPRPFYQKTYGDYDHLARRGEWAALQGEDQ